MEIIYFISLLIIFAPTFIANAVPVIIKNIPIIKNYNKSISEKYFWKNKTYRWFIFWVLFALLSSLLIFFFLKDLNLWEISDIYYSIIYSEYLAILAWLLQWVWALTWDLFESYIKRKIWKKPWEAWPFWDGVDYIIGSLIFFCFIFIPSLLGIIFLVLFAPFISLVANFISYLFWWKDVWY